MPRHLRRGSAAETLARVGRSHAAAAKLRGVLPNATVTLSPMTGGARQVANPRGALTAPDRADSRAIAANVLRSHAGGVTWADSTNATATRMP